MLFHSSRKGVQVLDYRESVSEFQVYRDRTDGKTFLDQVGCPVVVGEGRAFLEWQVGYLGGLDDERVQESEERERQPRSRLLRIGLGCWVLISKCRYIWRKTTRCSPKPHLRIKRDVLARDYDRDDSRDECKDCDFAPHEPSIFDVNRGKGKRGKGV